MSWLLTGGTGRLGTELQKQSKKIDLLAPTKEEFDITKPNSHYYPVEGVIHAAAYTNVDKAEIDSNHCVEVNVGGTARLAKMYEFKPFVYISSEHAPNSPNIYGSTKYGGEEVVRALCPYHLIIRTLFKPRPWPFDNAWTDQMTRGDYTDVIANLILETIEAWDKKTSATVYVGTERKSIYELAKQTKPDVKPSSRLEYPGLADRPGDYE